MKRFGRIVVLICVVFSAFADTAKSCPSARKFIVDPSGKTVAKDSSTVLSFSELPALLPGDEVNFVSGVHSLALLSKEKPARFVGLSLWNFAPIPVGTDESVLKACPIRFVGQGKTLTSLTQKIPSLSWIRSESTPDQTIYRASLVKLVDPSLLMKDPLGKLLTSKKDLSNDVTGLHFRGYYSTKSNLRIQFVPYQTFEEFTADSKTVFSWGSINGHVVQASAQPVYAGPGLFFNAWGCAQALASDPAASLPKTDMVCSLYMRTDSTSRQHALGQDANQPDPTKIAPLIYTGLYTDIGTQQRDLPRLEFTNLHFIGVHDLRFWGGLPAGILFKDVRFEVSSGPHFSAARKMTDIRFDNIDFTQDIPPFIHYSDMKNTAVSKIPALNTCAGRFAVANPTTENDMWASAGRQEPRELITCEPGAAGLFMNHGLSFTVPANSTGTLSNIQIRNSHFSRSVVPLGFFSNTGMGNGGSQSNNHLVQGSVFQFGWDEAITIGAGVARLTIQGNRFLDSMLGINTIPSSWEGSNGDFRVAVLENTFDLRFSEKQQPDGSFEPKPAYRSAGYPRFRPVDFKLPANSAVNKGAVDAGNGPLTCVHGSEGTCGGVSFYHNTVLIRKGSDEEVKPVLGLTRSISDDSSGFWNNLIVQMNPGVPAISGGAYRPSDGKIAVSINGNFYRLIGDLHSQVPFWMNAVELSSNDNVTLWCSRFARSDTGSIASINWGSSPSAGACQKLGELDRMSARSSSTDSSSKVEIFTRAQNSSAYVLSLPPSGTAPIVIPSFLPAPSHHRFGAN